MTNKYETKGRILCVTSNFPRWPGDSTTPFVLHLAKDLKDLGWTVDVLAPHAEAGTASLEVIDGVRVERFHYLWPQSLQTICYHGGALGNLRRSKSNLLKLPIFVASQWLAIFHRLTTRHYDLLHSHWILPQGFTGALATIPLGIPHVLTVHGGDVFSLKGNILKKFKRFALKHADAVTVNSSATEEAVKALLPSMRSLLRIPMGVATREISRQDPKVVELRQRYKKNEGPLLVFVGRLVEDKGLGDILKAIALLQIDMPDVSAMIVGEGQDRKSFEEMAKQLGIADRVHFVGWSQPDTVPAFLAAADYFVGPSRCIEAQGLTFIEAMVAKTPVIATRVGGIVDSVVDGETGLLVEKHSPEQIASAVREIYIDDALRQRMVNKAFNIAVHRFSRAASAERFSSLFSQLTKRH